MFSGFRLPCISQSSDIQCLTTIPGRLLNSLWKWGQFDREKLTLKLLVASWSFYSFLKGFRSFNAENLGSVSQRASKLPAAKLWEWLDPWCARTWAECAYTHFGWNGQSGRLFLKNSNFDSWWFLSLLTYRHQIFSTIRYKPFEIVSIV